MLVQNLHLNPSVRVKAPRFRLKWLGGSAIVDYRFELWPVLKGLGLSCLQKKREEVVARTRQTKRFAKAVLQNPQDYER